MQILKSRIDPHSGAFTQNMADHRAQAEKLHAQWAWVAEGKRDAAIARHHARGKLMVRERINLVIDPNTPFLELSSLAACGQYADQSPGAGIVTGIGQIHGIPTMIIANDATVKGGTLFPESVQKHTRAQTIAAEQRLPCLYLVDSGGAYLPEQDRSFPGKDHFGHSFYNQCRLSMEGLPQISVVLGGCTAGGAYVPALSDEVIIVRGIGRIFLGGPPIVKAALKEIVEAEALGGAELHTYRSGVSDIMVDTEEQAYVAVRSIFEGMNRPEPASTFDRHDPRPPLYDPAELCGIVPTDYKIGYDVREVIARIVDGSEFQEFKPSYGTTIVTGFARIHGYPIGIVANNGILFSEAALKATHFIELCNQRGTPLLFLQNTTGYMVGRDAEERGIAKDGAKMVAAVACSTVPKYTVLIGASFGAGNYGMCGRGFAPRFLFAWPNSTVATMSSETAETVLVDVRASKGAGPEDEAEIEALRQRVREQYTTQSDPYYATSRLWDDGIIEPAQTRDVLGLCLSLADRVPAEPTRHRVFRM